MTEGKNVLKCFPTTELTGKDLKTLTALQRKFPELCVKVTRENVVVFCPENILQKFNQKRTGATAGSGGF